MERMNYKLIVIKRIIIAILVIIASGIVGQLLLIAAYCIPTKNIALNIGRGAESLVFQGAEYNYAEDYTESILDNETDAVMLSEALFTGESCVKSAVMVPRYIFADRESQVLSLMAFLNHDDLSNASVINYPRYWHGYLVILKPLFNVFDYSDFKIINQGIQLSLIAILIVLMYKKSLGKYIIAFLPMLIIWNPATIGVSLQYAACFYVSMIGSIIVLMDKLKHEWLLFICLGIVTSYFDFLTYPIVTLGIPLIFWILINSEELKKPIKSIVTYGVCWSAGYIGMWSEKWILGSVISRENVIYDAIYNIGSRTSTAVDGEKVSRIGTVFRLIDATFFKWPYVLMLLGIALFLLAKCFRTLRINAVTIALFTISLMPIVWFMLTANHSFIHPRLVYRDWGITIFALLSIPLSGIDRQGLKK